MQLVGRKNEIKNLQWDLQKIESQFVAIYGRRRIGKTYLIREMFSDTFAFSHTGLRGGDKKAQLAAFRSSLVRFGRTKCPALRNCHGWTRRDPIFSSDLNPSGTPEFPRARKKTCSLSCAARPLRG